MGRPVSLCFSEMEVKNVESVIVSWWVSTRGF